MPEQLIFKPLESEVKIDNTDAPTEKGVEGLFAPPNPNPLDESVSTATTPSIAASLDPRELQRQLYPPTVTPDGKMAIEQTAPRLPSPKETQRSLNPIGTRKEPSPLGSITGDKPQEAPTSLPEIKPVVIKPVRRSIPDLFSPPFTIHQGIEIKLPDSDFNLDLRMRKVEADRKQAYGSFKKANLSPLEVFLDAKNFLEKIFPQNKP